MCTETGALLLIRERVLEEKKKVVKEYPLSGSVCVLYFFFFQISKLFQIHLFIDVCAKRRIHLSSFLLGSRGGGGGGGGVFSAPCLTLTPPTRFVYKMG